MKIIRYGDLAPQPWKNGGGVTRGIAVFPQGAGFDDFDWRLSIADVASGGPFSRFEGVDRTLVLIDGKGVDLIIDGDEHTLRQIGDMARFDGGSKTSSTLISGPVRDFNIMTRRDRFSHRAALLQASSSPIDSTGWQNDSNGNAILLFLLEDQMVTCDGEMVECGRFDTVFPEAGNVRITHSGIALDIRITPAA